MRLRAGLVAALAFALPLVAYTSASASVGTNAATRNTRVVITNRTTWDSVFSAPQAARGETTYARTCSRCHGPALAGADEAPALAGSAFLSSWNGQTLGELHTRIRTTMPTDTPGTYQRRDVADVIAYVLSYNRFPAGSSELPTGDEELKGITFVAARP